MRRSLVECIVTYRWWRRGSRASLSQVQRKWRELVTWQDVGGDSHCDEWKVSPDVPACSVDVLVADDVGDQIVTDVPHLYT